MPHYVLHVYTQAGYRPDLSLRSISRTRAERRARRLEREGFHTRVLTVRTPPAAQERRPLPK